MRGAHSTVLDAVALEGIIPAYAGSTEHPHGCLREVRDHPRVCGEHAAIVLASLPSSGSSPRMRGAPQPQYQLPWSAGIIPAYAGSTTRHPLSNFQRRDHPRVCGEHSGASSSTLRWAGSSPRMRGALVACSAASAHEGIIPAYAGSTPPKTRARTHGGDHPRVCGEHWLVGRDSVPSSGSSPRMRGALDGADLESLGLGIIPAYAGSTAVEQVPTSASRDHPRVCGEHFQHSWRP